ncbi:UvrD-helicase domain-containing protein [Oscillospiraceae bacterium HV4-5-C5C]|nr:UvrD-helicase domain-containing protein [Oscillospiraceae bacterium HV4-5-C5C]
MSQEPSANAPAAPLWAAANTGDRKEQRSLSPSALLEGLNPQQREAVMHDSGPLLILAGAGSGKTRVITNRLAYLIQVRRVSPYAILAITFTNKAANEMKERAAGLVGDTARSMWIGTFHSMFARILRQHADLLGYSKHYAIVDSDDQTAAIKTCMKELNIDEKSFSPNSVKAAISAAKNALRGPEIYVRTAGHDYRATTIAKVYQTYQRRLQANDAMDFDDILFNTVTLFAEHKDVLAQYQQRFRYIMVDEYQDTNGAQYQIVKFLAASHHNLCVVGDDDQSIYSFRGADIQNILDFEKDYPDARVIKLEQNYRSTKMVLGAANAVIAHNQDRKAKHLWTALDQGEAITLFHAANHMEEARYIAEEISRRVKKKNCSFGDFAVLYRANALSRNIESGLREFGIPYRIYGGLRFYDRKEIKDVLAYLRLVALPKDDLSFERVINTPRRGLGEVTLSRLRELAASQGLSLLDLSAEAGHYSDLGRAAARLQAFAGLIFKLRRRLAAADMSLAEFVEYVENESGLMQDILEQQEKGKDLTVDRIENLKELLTDAQEFTNTYLPPEAEQAVNQAGDWLLSAAAEDEASLQGLDTPDDAPAAAVSEKLSLSEYLDAFLERASLYSSMDLDESEQDFVRLMTIHSAKGLEYKVVFLVCAEEGIFPGYRSIGDEAQLEEERRLAYVAITRAKEKLYITTARSRILYGQTQSNPVSRFVTEIPTEFLQEIGGATDPFSQPRPSGQAYRSGGSGQSYQTDSDWSGATKDRSGPAQAAASAGAGAAGPAGPGQAKGSGAVLGDDYGLSMFKPATKPGRTRQSGGASRTPAGPAAMTEPAAAAGIAPADLQPGERIRHPKFGPGVLLRVEPVAGDAILQIRFDSGSTKRLMARQARLTKE